MKLIIKFKNKMKNCHIKVNFLVRLILINLANLKKLKKRSQNYLKNPYLNLVQLIQRLPRIMKRKKCKIFS